MAGNTGFDKTPVPAPDYDVSKVPEPIRRRSNWTRTKFTGDDVLESVAQIGEIAGLYAGEAKQLAERTQIRQDAVETQFDSVQRTATETADWGGEIIVASDGETTLRGRLERDFNYIETELSKKEDIVTPEFFGAIGNGLHDDTEMFRNAIEYAIANRVTLLTKPKSVYLVDDLVVEDGSDFKFDFRGVLKRKDSLAPYATNQDATSTITFKNCSNFQMPIINLDGNHINNHCVVGGDSYSHGGYAQEWRHSMVIDGCTDVKIGDINGLNPSGDVLYITGESERIFIDNIYGKSVGPDGAKIALGRNALSLISCSGVYISKVTSDWIGHTLMPGGLDIEPNYGDNVSDVYIDSVSVKSMGFSGLGIVNGYSNNELKNIFINQASIEHDLDIEGRTGFAFIIKGAKRVKIPDLRIKTGSRNYAMDIGRIAPAQMVEDFEANITIDGGKYGALVQLLKNSNLTFTFKNVSENFIRFDGPASVSDCKFDIPSASFIGDLTTRIAIFISASIINLNKITISGDLTYSKTGGRSVLTSYNVGKEKVNITLKDLDMSGWWEAGDSGGFYPIAAQYQNNKISKNNVIGYTRRDGVTNGNVSYDVGDVVINTNPVKLGSSGSKYVIKEWVCITAGNTSNSSVFSEVRVPTGD